MRYFCEIITAVIKKIIDFNNKKYYNSKLQVQSDSRERQPLVYVNVDGGPGDMKNTSPAEVEEIMRYAGENPDKVLLSSYRL